MRDTKNESLLPDVRPTLWCRRDKFGQCELYLHNPALAGPKWMQFESFELLVEWLGENPGVLLTKEELAKEYLQLSFDAFNLKEAGGSKQ